MIIEYLRYAVAAGQEDRFVAAYQQAAEFLERSPHCLAYEIAQCEEEPTAFVVRLEWDSTEGHLKGFRKGPEFAAFFAAVRPFVPAIQEMRHYRLTPVRSGTAPVGGPA